MKALSLTQPWASLVVEGHKAYETRSWPTKYRGSLAIHASKGFPRSAKLLLGTEESDGDDFICMALNRPAEEMHLGRILGTVDLVDCQETWDVLGSETIFISQAEHAFGDWAEGRYAWKLENPVKFQYSIPAKGSLGLWTIPLDILSTVESTQERAPVWRRQSDPIGNDLPI